MPVHYEFNEQEFIYRFYQIACNAQSFSSPTYATTIYTRFLANIRQRSRAGLYQSLQTYLKGEPVDQVFGGLFPLQSSLNHSCANSCEIMDCQVTPEVAGIKVTTSCTVITLERSAVRVGALQTAAQARRRADDQLRRSGARSSRASGDAQARVQLLVRMPTVHVRRRRCLLVYRMQDCRADPRHAESELAQRQPAVPEAVPGVQSLSERVVLLVGVSEASVEARTQAHLPGLDEGEKLVVGELSRVFCFVVLNKESLSE